MIDARPTELHVCASLSEKFAHVHRRVAISSYADPWTSLPLGIYKSLVTLQFALSTEVEFGFFDVVIGESDANLVVGGMSLDMFSHSCSLSLNGGLKIVAPSEELGTQGRSGVTRTSPAHGWRGDRADASLDCVAAVLDVPFKARVLGRD